MRNESLGSADAIRERMSAELGGVSVYAFDETTSTNRLALDYAESGEWGGEPVIFIADGQTAGRGRLGRSFISPKGSGIYLSILTRVADDSDGGYDPIGITTYAAVVAARVIERLTGLSPDIKWVNDLYLGGRKLVGILTQGVVDTADGKLRATVMGIGINVLGNTLPDEIKEIATTLEIEYSKLNVQGPLPERAELAAAIASEFISDIHLVGTREVAEEYRGRSFLIGQSVTVHTPTETYPATVVGIDDECHLLIRHADGSPSVLSTGEVSVRLEEKSASRACSDPE